MKTMKRIMALAMVLMLAAALIPAVAMADVTVLRKGDEGEDVIILQTALAKLGYYSADVTGYFGQITEEALIRYQKDAGLTPDGICGKGTLETLQNSKASKLYSETNAQKDGLLQLGDEGTDVVALQLKLQELGLFNNAVTGYFGPVTEKAVKLYQSGNDVDNDGVVGAVTQKLLDKNYKNSTLAPGMKSDDVKAMQQKLVDLGYLPSGKATGFFGTLTSEAVEYFQKANGLTVDGIAGSSTMKKLNSDKAVTEKEYRRSTADGKNAKSTEKSKKSDDKKETEKDSKKETKKESKKEKDTEKSTSKSSKADDLIAYAKKFLGTPYVYGANGPNRFDCTGFTCYVFKHQAGISLPRSAYNQGYNDYGTKITSVSDLKPGDLVFFNTISDSDRSDHAGIYIGNGEFIHCGSGRSGAGRCVKIQSLTSGYYSRVFVWGRRVL